MNGDSNNMGITKVSGLRRGRVDFDLSGESIYWLVKTEPVKYYLKVILGAYVPEKEDLPRK